jgi:2-methylcitrate dehydratase PrpD
MGETATLAQFCATLSYERLPAEVIRAIKSVVLDSLGTTLAGTTLGEGCAEVLAVARRGGGAREATLVGFGERVPALMAALANGGVCHSLNYDASGIGHPGSVLAAPLAAAELRGGVDGRRFITGMAAGLEVMARSTRAVARAEAPGSKAPDTALEGQLNGYFAAAVASGQVLGLDAAKMHSAFGIALMQAAGSMQVVFDGDPPAKAVYAAFSNHGGLLSAMLAESGLEARIEALEGRAGFFALHFGGRCERSELVQDLGSDYRLVNVAFKPWPSSGITHPFVEAALELGRLRPGDVAAIRLSGGTRARHWFEPEEIRRHPASPAAAANSVFYTVGRALAKGRLGLEDFTGGTLADPDTAQLIDRMSYSLDDALGSSGVVEVEKRDGSRLVKRVDRPLGTRTKPMSQEQLAQKFADCARFAARPVDVERIVAIVEHLETLPDMAALLAVL